MLEEAESLCNAVGEGVQLLNDGGDYTLCTPDSRSQCDGGTNDNMGPRMDEWIADNQDQDTLSSR